MNYENLLKNLGFEADPFSKTNADEEEMLDKYFIEPPFFPAVFGSPRDPKSVIIFAPRGNGKTALKRKIELISKNDNNFLCVTYNTFSVTGLSINDISQEYHLKNIIRLVLVGIITAIQEKGIDMLEKNDRHFIYLFSKYYLSKIARIELKAAIDSIKNFSEKAKDVWNNFTGPIGIVINALLQQIGLMKVELKKFESEGGILGTSIDQLKILQGISKKLGYNSIYVLIDKVDENSLTHGADKSYKFIETLLTDLQILELKAYGFKFFLWDLLLDSYRAVARPDRVKYYELSWNISQLKNMLGQRLRAHSNEKVKSLKQLMSPTYEFDLDEYICYFAQGSPRNVIRICKEIFDQQSDIEYNSYYLFPEAIDKGFNVISNNISRERYTDNLIKDLIKTRRCDFTIRHVYSNVFKFSQQAGLNKIKSWEDAGAVKLLGKVQETKGARTSNHYGLNDLLLAKTVFNDISIFDFSRTKLVVCSCDKIILRDYDISPKHTCEFCQVEIDMEQIDRR